VEGLKEKERMMDADTGAQKTNEHDEMDRG